MAILIIGECVFLQSAWPRVSATHHFFMPPVAILPYYLLYKCTFTKSFITPENHEKEMRRYPYDRVIFHPGHRCRTCCFLKPARSKHCNTCKACVSRHDHHCVWLANCVGLHNYRYFLSFLASLSGVLIYGSFAGYSLLNQDIVRFLPPDVQSTKSQNALGLFRLLGSAIARDKQVGSTTLLAFMTAPLSMAFLVYHTYLIWAGMTTNENGKWSDWKYYASMGCVFKSSKAAIYGELSPPERRMDSWPASSDQVLLLVEDGQPPTTGLIMSATSNRVDKEGDVQAPVDRRWVRVRSLADIDNIYDLGFWDNLRHAMRLPTRRRASGI